MITIMLVLAGSILGSIPALAVVYWWYTREMKRLDQ